MVSVTECEGSFHQRYMVATNLRVLASHTVSPHVGCCANVHLYSARQVSDGCTAASAIKLLGYLVTTCAQPNALV